MKRVVFLVVLALWGPASGAMADELSICYNYGCAARASVYLRGAALLRIRMLFSQAQDAEGERNAIAQAIGHFIAYTGKQTPTFRDRGRNLPDEGQDGRMDCIDHARNTTLYLKLMEERGWLKFHEILDPVSRPHQIIGAHWAARIAEREKGPESVSEYVIDSWFFDPGHPAAVFTLEEWMKGAEPNE